VVKILGISDEQVLDVGELESTADAGRSLTLTTADEGTRVRFELAVDPLAPVPGYLIKKGAKGLMKPPPTDCGSRFSR
jgi:hypothetical protein